jgi:hypothetical protein
MEVKTGGKSERQFVDLGGIEMGELTVAFLGENLSAFISKGILWKMRRR